MATFDFAFCLWSGCEAKGDAVKSESLAELGKGAGDVGEKEGVEIDIKRERESVREECAGEKMEVCGEVFGRVNTGTSVEACGVVDDVEKGIFTGVAGEPSVRRSIVLPKCAEVADLPPAPNRAVQQAPFIAIGTIQFNGAECQFTATESLKGTSTVGSVVFVTVPAVEGFAAWFQQSVGANPTILVGTFDAASNHITLTHNERSVWPQGTYPNYFADKTVAGCKDFIVKAHLN